MKTKTLQFNEDTIRRSWYSECGIYDYDIEMRNSKYLVFFGNYKKTSVDSLEEAKILCQKDFEVHVSNYLIK